MKKVFLILFVIFISSCTENSTDVDIYGVSFTCPAGWKVMETEDYGIEKFISIGKKGFTGSGLVTISFIEGDIDSNEHLQIFQESLEEQKELKNIVFQAIEESYYGKYKGIESSYTFKTFGTAFKGTLYVFQENGITVAIIHQEAIEDHNKNLNGFETIKESLTFKLRE